jgi:hypothetical protein
MLDARTWIYTTLMNDAGVKTVFGDPPRVMSTLGEDPAATPEEKPFAIIRLGTVPRGMPEGGVTIDATIWVHDIPTTYVNIDAGIEKIKAALERPILALDGVAAHWTDDSADLSDDARQTNVRTTSFRLAARR